MAGNSNIPGGTCLALQSRATRGTTVMSNEIPTQQHGQSIADKISKLSVFIGDDLDARAAHGLHITGGCYLLIARSPESPVAQALRGHAVRMASMGIRVRAIF
ncbi:hypothetical protein MXD81_11925, partial [Microbacteriaceae bacterium K1510]|nr:hypothetical protein [Microbacteriaceae bacterium K1510]